MKKMNNKGFSLVELIVVVLIMAIIAVALAPQVMKWVENSRKSTDIENYNALIEAANVASTNEKVIATVTDSNSILIQMTSNDTNSTTITGGTDSASAFKTMMTETLPNWDKTKITSGDWKGSTFNISITKAAGKGIKVEKGSCYPTKDFE